MRRWVGVGAAAGMALLLTAGAAQAAGPQAGPTRVTNVKAFEVDGKVKVDVMVAHPDARAGRATHKATNRGVVGVTVRAADGTVLSSHHATAKLPVEVRDGRSVTQTYRFVLPGSAAQQVADAGRVVVQTVAESWLDPDGPGPDPRATNGDSDTATATVRTLGADPPVWTYRRIWFDTSTGCDIEGDECDASFGSKSDSPFDDDSYSTAKGTVKIERQGSDAKRITVVSRGSSFVEGWVTGMGDDRLQINGGTVPKWGSGTPYSASHGAGEPGQLGGPMHLWINSTGWFQPYAHEWRLEGYLAMGQ